MTKQRILTFSAVSRRRFIGTSLATGLAGMVPWGEAFGGEAFGTTGVGEADAGTGKLTLRVTGNSSDGYGVTFLFDAKPIARHNGGGEFSAIFQNEERSLEDRAENWRATSWTGNQAHVTLQGECTLPNLNATVFVWVEYEVITSQVVRKRVSFRQVDMFMLFCQVTNSLEPLEPPAKFWSFNQVDCQGGALREYYPAAGFRTKAGVTVGLLTDSGYRNHWSRVVRRDGKPRKPAALQIPDVNLYHVSRPGKPGGNIFVSQTFGEALVQSDNQISGKVVSLPSVSGWRQQGTLNLEERNGTIVLSPQSSDAGVIIPFPAEDGEVYSLSLQYRSQQAFALQVWDVDDRLQKLEAITQYNDGIPESPAAWSDFRTTVFVYSRRGSGGAVFISAPQSEQGSDLKAPHRSGVIELRGLEIRRQSTHHQPYHRLEMDRTSAKTSFIFIDDKTPDTIRGYRLSSQVHLADGLGFRGGETEKVLYSDLMMLTWAAELQGRTPMLAPSIWYSAAGEMYLRDSFFALSGVHNRELNEAVFNVWAANQGTDGAINTLVEPNMANLERKANDSTPLWLMWALQNRARFGADLPMDKVRKAAEYCLRTYDQNHDGSCWAQFVMGQLDVVRYPEGTSDLCENQGMLAVTLRVIKALEIPGVNDRISEDYIQKAEKGYRSYYDPTLKRIRPSRQVADAIGFGEIFPEFLSLWLFRRKILTDEMLVNHLDRIPVLMPRRDAPFPEVGGTVRPIFIGLGHDGKDWSYFTDTWHPMISDEHGATYAHHNMDGIYYNGGSWMRIEICGYVAGKLHGWGKADKAISNRLWAETNASPDFPTTQEYLATDPAHPFFGFHRVFAWNSFVLQALEMVGIRKPEMDPDYSKWVR